MFAFQKNVFERDLSKNLFQVPHPAQRLCLVLAYILPNVLPVAQIKNRYNLKLLFVYKMRM